MPLRFSTCFVIILGVTEISCSFRLVLEVKAGKGIPESSRLEFLEKFLTRNFHLSDAEGNNSRPLDRRVIADLSSFRILLTICQKFYWSFISIWKFGNFKNTFATITYLSELYIWFRRFILLVEMKNEKSDFYELWQHHKQLNTMGMNETWPDIYDEGYINSNLNPLTKFFSSSRSTKFKDILPWIIFQMITISHNLYNETGHSVLSLKESQ